MSLESESRAQTSSYVEMDLAKAETYEAHRFGKRRRTRMLDRWEKDLARRMFEKVGAQSHILDAPCGTGRFFDTFSAANRLTMLDISPSMLEVCKRRGEGRDNVALILGNLTAIPLPDNSIDLCWCMRLFHHLPTDALRSAILREMSRVSRRYVALTFYNSQSGRTWFRRLTFRKFRGDYTTYPHLVGLAAAVGLTPVLREPKINWNEQQCFVLFQKG